MKKSDLIELTKECGTRDCLVKDRKCITVDCRLFKQGKTWYIREQIYKTEDPSCQFLQEKKK